MLFSRRTEATYSLASPVVVDPRWDTNSQVSTYSEPTKLIRAWQIYTFVTIIRNICTWSRFRHSSSATIFPRNFTISTSWMVHLHVPVSPWQDHGNVNGVWRRYSGKGKRNKSSILCSSTSLTWPENYNPRLLLQRT